MHLDGPVHWEEKEGQLEFPQPEEWWNANSLWDMTPWHDYTWGKQQIISKNMRNLLILVDEHLCVWVREEDNHNADQGYWPDEVDQNGGSWD